MRASTSTAYQFWFDAIDEFCSQSLADFSKALRLRGVRHQDGPENSISEEPEISLIDRGVSHFKECKNQSILPTYIGAQHQNPDHIYCRLLFIRAMPLISIS